MPLSALVSEENPESSSSRRVGISNLSSSASPERVFSKEKNCEWAWQLRTRIAPRKMERVLPDMFMFDGREV